MSWKIALVCCLMVAVIPNPGNTRLFSWLPGYQGFFGGQNAVTNTATGILSGAKQAVNTIAGVKSQVLSSVVNTTKQALDVGVRLTAPIPLVGTAVGLGTNMMKAGADVVNSVGQAKITFFQNLKNAKLTMIERMFGISGTTTVRPTTTSRPTTISTNPSTTATTTRSLTTSTSATTTTRSTTSTPAITSTTATVAPTTTTTLTSTASTTTSIPTTAGTSSTTLATAATSAATTVATLSG